MHLNDFRVFWQMASMLQLSSVSAHSSTSGQGGKTEGAISWSGILMMVWTLDNIQIFFYVKPRHCATFKNPEYKRNTYCSVLKHFLRKFPDILTAINKSKVLTCKTSHLSRMPQPMLQFTVMCSSDKTLHSEVSWISTIKLSSLRCSKQPGPKKCCSGSDNRAIQQHTQ